MGAGCPPLYSTLPRRIGGAQQFVVKVAAPIAQHVVEVVQLPRAARGHHVHRRQQHLFAVVAGGAGSGPALRTDDQAAADKGLARCV